MNRNENDGGNLLVIILIIVVIIFIWWWWTNGQKAGLCAPCPQKIIVKEGMKHKNGDYKSDSKMSKEEAMTKEMKYMSNSLDKMADEEGDHDLKDVAYDMKETANGSKHMTDDEIAEKMLDFSTKLRACMGQKDYDSLTKELEAMIDCLEDMTKDIDNKEDQSVEKYTIYSGLGYPNYWGIRRAYWPLRRYRYNYYYYPYRYYNPYYYGYSWRGYW